MYGGGGWWTEGEAHGIFSTSSPIAMVFCSWIECSLFIYLAWMAVMGEGLGLSLAIHWPTSKIHHLKGDKGFRIFYWVPPTKLSWVFHWTQSKSVDSWPRKELILKSVAIVGKSIWSRPKLPSPTCQIKAGVTRKCMALCCLNVNFKREEYHHPIATSCLSVVVNFMCQLTCTTGCPDIWSHNLRCEFCECVFIIHLLFLKYTSWYAMSH